MIVAVLTLTLMIVAVLIALVAHILQVALLTLHVAHIVVVARPLALLQAADLVDVAVET